MTDFYIYIYTSTRKVIVICSLQMLLFRGLKFYFANTQHLQLKFILNIMLISHPPTTSKPQVTYLDGFKKLKKTDNAVRFMESIIFTDALQHSCI